MLWGLGWEQWRHWLVGLVGEIAAVYVGAGASWMLTLAGWQEAMLDQLYGQRECPGLVSAGKSQSEKNTVRPKQWM